MLGENIIGSTTPAPAKELQKGSASKSWSNCSLPREMPKQKYWLAARRERTE